MKVFFCLFALLATSFAYRPALSGHEIGWNRGWAGNVAGLDGYGRIGLVKSGYGAGWGAGLGWKGAGAMIAPPVLAHGAIGPVAIAHGPISHATIAPAPRIIAAAPIYAAGPAIAAAPIGYSHGITSHGWNSGKGLW